MTLENFLEKLEQTPRDWWRDEFGKLRRGVAPNTWPRQCPVSSIEGRSAADWDCVVRATQMGFELGWQIVNAADNRPTQDPALRAKLLKACGLEAA